MPYLTGLFALLFAAIHLLVGRLRFLDVVPRSRLLSGAGGVAVAYVFLHILPELAAHEETFADALPVEPITAEAVVYLVTPGGLIVFYGREHAVKVSRGRARTRGDEDAIEAELFRLHIGAFAIYNALIGYLLVHREASGRGSLVLFFVAMALHFITTDFGLRQDQKARYDHSGRWIISAAVVSGWGIGTLAGVPEFLVGLLFAFLAGGVVLNVLKEELPEERQSLFWPFLAGAGGYAILLLFA